uniref:Uncharacterized protein n=1 Tax=Anguilla anguilla TaxID=7936 RepID=A0A0E9XJE3_ANGAN
MSIFPSVRAFIIVNGSLHPYQFSLLHKGQYKLTS